MISLGCVVALSTCSPLSDRVDVRSDWIDAAVQTIGPARVVALGEATHGDGTSFVLKTRLIERLVDEGFDVLAFESSLYAVDAAGEKVSEGMTPSEALADAIFPVWSRAEQFAGLLDLLDKAASKGRPIALVGFDFQLSPRQRDLVATRLEAIAARMGEEGEPVRRVLSALDLFIADPQAAPDAIDLSALDADRRAALAAIHAAQGPGVVEDLRWVDSAARFVRFASVLPRALRSQDPGAELNVRDKVMADNLTAQALALYPDRRIMLWGASSHFIKDRTAIEVTSEAGMVPMGAHLAQGPLAKDYVAIGFSTLGGTTGSLRGKTFDLPAAGPETIEAMAMAAHPDADTAFVAMPACGSERIVARPLGHAEWRGDWGCALDGLVVSRTLEPTRYPELPSPSSPQ